MPVRPIRLRRMQLCVPGSNEKMLLKPAASQADTVICDLEDAVAPNAKVEARERVAMVLNATAWGKKTRSVRINDVGLPWCHDDVITVFEMAGASIDTIVLAKACANFKNEEGLRTEAVRAKSLGMVGKWAIHPAQIYLRLQLSTPPAADIAHARKLEAAYRQSELQGLGAVQVDGVMVDAAVMRMVKNTLARAELIGV